jgi:uncharacterized membrane protein YkvA (DUF1232 family)
MLSRGRHRRRSGLLRALRWLAFVPIASRLPMYSRLIWALAKDSRIPASRKAILVGAVGYVLVGRDLVPDEIPILGGIDDLAVVVLAVELFFEGVPDEVLAEKIKELDIDGDVFRRDMDQVRRVTPAPVRKIIRRLPDALEGAGRFAKQARLGPLIRSWIARSWATKEESFA